MGVMMLQVLSLVLKVCAFACSLVIQGSAVPHLGEATPGHVFHENLFISIAPTPVPQPNGTNLQPPLVTPPAPVPQATEGLPPSSTWPSPSTSPPNLYVPPPAPLPVSVPAMPPIPPSGQPQHSEQPPSTVQAPVASPFSNLPPINETHPTVPGAVPPNPHPPAVAPVSDVPATPESRPPSQSVLPQEPPSSPPDASTHPALPRSSPPVEPVQNEPPSSPPDRNASPILAPPPSISNEPAAMPVAAPGNKNAYPYAPPSHSPTEDHNASRILAPPPSISHKPAATPVAPPANKTAYPSAYAPLSHSPTEAPTASKHVEAPPPHGFPKSTGSRSPIEHHHEKVYNITPAPLADVVPPPSSGSTVSAPPIPSKTPSSDNHYAPIPAPPPGSAGESKFPFVFPKISPSASPPRIPKIPQLPPLRALPPPPPPNKDCGPLMCTEPLTYGPPESPCVCVLPIQVGLRLSVALYTFFPLVSELAAEIAAGVFMKQSQVRIMGANAAGDDPEKTIVLIDLLPLGERFDDTTAYLTFQRFWLRQVAIQASFFGDYDVLYVRYPGLPPSPPLPPSTIGVIPSKPYPGRDNNARTMHPLGVDISGKQQRHGLSRSILATIILSCFVALILLSAVAWVFIFRHRHHVLKPNPTPPTTLLSQTKSSAKAASIVESGTSSPPFSLGSSIAAYTGSAKTFSASEIERATDFFNEARILGEGGFGLVYRGVLDDGAEVAMKILKRYDQQSGREFLAEVEMLSRLHHRNLVKLIGICVEDRIRCLVYELIPNGSVDSHLHGLDKERSPLDWSKRLKIALGSARALAYLHEDSSPRVIHRDFKASNILLEDDFTPKVSDFGLARTALDEENRHISTRVMGTFGYVAPEYAMTGHLLVKSDVYSYGVVLLELLTGRKPVDMTQPPGQENLVSWARALLTSREGLESIVDQSISSDLTFDSIAKVAAIASMCVQPEVSHRPFMGEVVQALKLVCNECDELREFPSRSCSQEDLSLVTEARNSSAKSDRLLLPALSPSTVSDYDYRHDVERDLSMSELLSSSTKFGEHDCESFRRHSSSGPLRMGKKPMWKTMRGSVSEHGMLSRLWPGSH